MPATTSINGVISGLDTSGIIDKLLELERAPIERLQSKQDTLKAKIAAWQEINTRILALKTKADTLASSINFDTKLFSSDDDTILKGSVSNLAQTGTYYIKVNALAKAHQLKSDGYADTDTTKIGTGTITIAVGTGTPKVITIDENNNTLEGIKQAINQSGAGVTAAIVNDGSSTNPYRLVVTSNTLGMSGQMNVSINLTGGTAPTFTTLQAAQSASVTLGEGDGAITIIKDTNQINNLIPGITLNLQKADPNKTVTVNITQDTETLKQNIKDFIEQYNNLVDYVNQQFKYDTESNVGGTLFADSDLETIQSDLMNKIFNPVDELNQSIRVLSQIGVNSLSDNKLELDEGLLDEVLTNGTDAVKRLFSAVGETSNASLSYAGSTSDTNPSPVDAYGNPLGYSVEITSVATQGWIKAGTTLPANLAQDEQLIINGVAVQLTAGMTPDQVVSTINESSTKTGVTASITADGYLTLTNIQYGSAKAIIVSSEVSGAGSSGFYNALSRVTAGTAQTGDLAQDETLTINGVEIQLTAGMTKLQVVNKINQYYEQTGVVASRTGADGTGTGDYLTLTSTHPGTDASINAISSISSGAGITSGLGNVQVTQLSPAGETGTGTGVVGTSDGILGTDVAGTINGKAATGRGQVLTSTEGDSIGLAVKFTGSTTGNIGTVTLTKGVGAILSGYLDYITRPTTGIVNSARDALQNEIDQLNDEISDYEERVTAKQDALIAKFAAMESAMGKLKNEGDYLASQISAASSGWKK